MHKHFVYISQNCFTQKSRQQVEPLPFRHFDYWHETGISKIFLFWSDLWGLKQARSGRFEPHTLCRLFYLRLFSWRFHQHMSTILHSALFCLRTLVLRSILKYLVLMLTASISLGLICEVWGTSLFLVFYFFHGCKDILFQILREVGFNCQLTRYSTW